MRRKVLSFFTSRGFYAPMLVGLAFAAPTYWWCLGMNRPAVEYGVRMWLAVTIIGWLFVMLMLLCDFEYRGDGEDSDDDYSEWGW